MIRHPILLIIILLLIEITVLSVSAHPRFKKYFNFLPAIFWIYFLPMVVSTFGVIDAKSPIYQKLTTNLLPASLFLLLMAVDVKAILQLGKTALTMFIAGMLGIMIGGVTVFFIFKRWVGEEFWAGFGVLTASWTGGSANMIAAKEALGVSDQIFLPMVIVDTIVPYTWMGVLVGLAGMQAHYDRWNHSNRHVIDELKDRLSHASQEKVDTMNLTTTCLILALAAAGSFAAQFFAQFFPVIKDAISTYTWTIILVSVAGLVLSLTPMRNVKQYGSNRIGYFLLYFVLTTIGAKASLANIGSTLILIVAGFLIVIIHTIVLVCVSRWIKAPMFLVATSTQANIGGVASAPIVAEIYQPGFASVGLLLAIFGNIVGTYVGIMTAQICRFLTAF